MTKIKEVYCFSEIQMLYLKLKRSLIELSPTCYVYFTEFKETVYLKNRNFSKKKKLISLS